MAGGIAVWCLAAAATPAIALPPPQFARSVDIGLISGIVIVRPPHRPPFRLTPVDRSIPVGSRLDTSRGAVDLRSVRPVTGVRTGARRTVLQDGHFSGGVFAVLQRRSQRGLTVLALLHSRAAERACGGQAARATPGGRVIALLHSDVHGDFRTRGRYSAATVRGTEWDTIDRCDGTLTRVRRGSVEVFDFRLRRQVAVSAGQSYLARVA